MSDTMKYIPCHQCNGRGFINEFSYGLNSCQCSAKACPTCEGKKLLEDTEYTSLKAREKIYRDALESIKGSCYEQMIGLEKSIYRKANDALEAADKVGKV